MTAPLDGVKIVDMTSVIMGPYATQILADLGADVLKVESLTGDTMRAVGPKNNADMGCLFIHTNRNKKSIAINLKTDNGKKIIKKILQDADVLVSNIRPDAMKRLGLAYEDVRKINPEIIQVDSYGFSESGPYSGQPAYDDLIQGISAIPALSQMAGLKEPKYVPTLIADRTVGLHIAINILAALVNKKNNNQGQHIEVPMFEILSHMVLGDHLGGETFMPPRGEMGYARLLSEYRKPYKTADGYICVVVYTDKHWQAFLKLTGDEDLLKTDDRFSTLQKRTEHIGELYSLVEQRLIKHTSQKWLHDLKQADIPAMPLHTPETLLNDPHLNSVDFFYEEDHPTEGKIKQMKYPSHWSSARREKYTPAPRLGENSREVLTQYGFSEAEINAFAKENIIKQ